MKLFSIITAICATVFLYIFVFQRDALLDVTSSQATQAGEQSDVQETSTVEGDEKGAFRVVVLRSQEVQSQSVIKVRGEVQAAREVHVAAETTGVIVSEPLQKGHFVETGDLMCHLALGTREARLAEAKARLIDAKARVPEAEAAIAEAGARVDEANINLNAAQKLLKDGYASEARLSGAKATLEAAIAGAQRASSAMSAAEAGIEAAIANVETAQKEIEKTTIRAPFSGFLESDTAELGTLMQPGSLCGHIVQLDSVNLVGFVTEAEVKRISVGDIANARFITGQSIEGVVSFLSRSADARTRTFEVEVEVENSDLSLRGGQTVEMSIASIGGLAHNIPQSALTLNDGGLMGVRAVDNNKIVRFHPVTLLRDTSEFATVSGLPPQLDVIVVGQGFVREGVRVSPIFQNDQQGLNQ